jgi:hypothetical protein
LATDKLLLTVDLVKTHNNQRPTLIFCDLKIVDENPGNAFNNFLLGQKIFRMRPSQRFYHHAHQAGSPLFKMHDWWFAMKAATFGTITFLDRPLVRYRQHTNNAIGAQIKDPQKAISRVR